MIKSIEDLCEADRRRFGDKPVDLAGLRRDIVEQGFDCVLPEGYAADLEEVDDIELREVFDYLREQIQMVVGEKIMGALICRSAALGEKSGRNVSVPSLYDGSDIEGSWARFRSAFDKVRFDPEREGDKEKPVFMQVFQGTAQYMETGYRNMGSFQWPKWPEWSDWVEDNDESGQGLMNCMTPIVEEIRDICRREGEVKWFYVMDQNGSEIQLLQISDLAEDLEAEVFSIYSDLACGSACLREGNFALDDDGRIIDWRGEVIANVGDELVLAWRDVPVNPVIGFRDEGMVARSHHYSEPSRMSVEICRGLTSYLVGGLPSREGRLRGKMLYYFDPDSGEFVEGLNLGHDSRKASMAIGEHYYQSHVEVFSLDEGEVGGVSDLGVWFLPKFEDGEFKGSLLEMIQFYARKRAMPIEIEGAFIDGQLHVYQVGASPLPDDVVDELSDVLDEEVLFESEVGRGAVCYRGDVVIDYDGDFFSDYFLVLGFDETVSRNSRFLYLATGQSVMAEAGRDLVMLESHLAGYACQVTFEAAGEGRQGGVYYISSKDEFLQVMAPFIEEVEGRKVLRNVCVEACREGMQIYRINQ